MRPNTEVQFRQETNMEPEQSVRMSVDAENIQHIMTVLTDLYSDPMMAVIREYSTNALDSHIAAGVTKPIEVSLPGPFRRDYVVRDFGTGLSVDDLLNICSKYGYSTKRGNDNESGMLGLGFKAGLTYTDQFSVTAVKDGVKTVARVKRDEDGAGVIDIIDTSSTDDPNGVAIKVAVKDTHLFNTRAREFFRFWSKGTVLVDDAEPEPVEGLRVTDDITVVPNHSLRSDYVVMGNIGYAAERRLSLNLPYGYSVVANVKMGEVNFTPNREALHYTPRTEVTLQRIMREVAAGVEQSAQREIDKCDSHYDAMIASQHWRRLSRKTFTYKGEQIPEMFSNPDGWVYNLNAYRYAVNAGRTVALDHFDNGIQVTNYDNTTVTTSVRRKIREYLNQNSIDVKYVILTPGRIGGAWTKGLREVDFADIKAIKLSNGNSGPGVGAPVTYYEKGMSRTAPVDRVPGQNKVLFSPADDIVGRDLALALPDATLVKLARNRWEKFMRENKGTKDINDALKQTLTDIRSKLTLAERIHINGYSHRLRHLRDLDAEKIDDPALSELVAAYKKKVDDDRVLHYRRVVNMMRSLDVEIESDGDSWGEILDKYPLLKYTEVVPEPEHVYEYVNYFYTKETE